MKLEQARVAAQRPFAGEYRILELECPAIAEAVRPGQFVHLQVPRLDGAVLRRPFSVFKAGRRTLAILYKRVGRGTEAMARLAGGDEVSLMGPLGNGFPLELQGTFPVLVAGGYGVAPLAFLAERLPSRGAVFIGGATAADILCEADFEKLGWKARVATEDDSRGERGLVTDVLDGWLSRRAAGAGRRPKTGVMPCEFFACGPDGMLRALGERAIALGAKAWLSLDKHMGCGVGACLACVQKTRKPDGSESWSRVCREGPVFEAREIVWG